MDLFANVISSVVSSSLIAPMRGIQRARYQTGDSTPFHSANYFHALITLSGEAVFQEQRGEEFTCRPGTFLAIPRDVFYKWRIERETVMLQCIHDSFSFVEHRAMANLFGTVNKHLFHFDLEPAAFETVARAFDADALEDEPIRGLLLSADWQKLMVLATARFNAGDKANHPALVKAMNFLAENAERNVPLETLARKAGLGVSRLSQLFRESVGMSPLRHLALLKAERATNLLLTEGLSVGEIAERLGFTSTSAFRRFYKNQTGSPPGQVVNRKSRR